MHGEKPRTYWPGISSIRIESGFVRAFSGKESFKKYLLTAAVSYVDRRNALYYAYEKFTRRSMKREGESER